MSEKELKYVELSDEEVEELVLKRLKEIRELLEEIKRIFEKAGV
ncbi:MAG: hypothetical protein ACP5II_03595 [Infirmifilum sp.]|mgnify:CR=1 FL=1|nr:hypothetical protein [Infirmifilum uzonense]